MTNENHLDTIYDRDLRIIRIVREFTADGVIAENGSNRGIKLIPSEYFLRRFTRLFDANGLPIYEGDFLRVGMRRADESGWTVEIVAWNDAAGEWGLLDLLTGTEFMQMQRDAELRQLTGKNIFITG